MTKLEIINETVAYYEEDPARRAYSSSMGCLYRDTRTGNKCAAGRCFTEDALSETQDLVMEVDKLVEYLDNDFDDLLLPQYRGHEVAFWMDLQKFHDNAFLWDNGESSKSERKTFANNLRRAYT